MHIPRDEPLKPLKIAIWREGFRSISQIRNIIDADRDIGVIITIVLHTS